jgi:hypothetical protein
MKPEVFQVSVETRPPRGNDPGQVVLGYYIIADRVITMTDAKGAPAPDDTGKSYTAKLAPNDDAYVIAGRLTKKLRDALRGKRDAPTGFSGPLDYGSSGNAPY